MGLFEGVKWDQLAAALAVAAALYAVAVLALRRSLGADFLTKDSIRTVFDNNFSEAAKPMLDRLVKIETVQLGTPTREVVRDIERRVEKVEIQVTEVQRTVTDVQVGVGSLRTGQDAIHQQITGVSRQLDLLTGHLLSKESA